MSINLLPASVGFVLDLLVDLEDHGNTFLRNVSLSDLHIVTTQKAAARSRSNEIAVLKCKCLHSAL
jgi:hypothetical protein